MYMLSTHYKMHKKYYLLHNKMCGHCVDILAYRYQSHEARPRI